MNLETAYQNQQFQNGYELVDGVAMHAQNSDSFHIPHQLLKDHVGAGHFVELRIDSPRFSVHQDAIEKCYCSSCNGEMSKPILSHSQPASLFPLPEQSVPSRGWGEDFWVQITDRQDQWIAGVVDNPLVEARMHGIQMGDKVLFHQDHILAVHPSHRQEIVLAMSPQELKTLAQWIGAERKRD